MRHYVGEKTAQGFEVDVLDAAHPGGGYPLDPRFDLRRHSLDGFAWGYSGSGPAQLSLALLADALEDDRLAEQLYQDFKFQVVARLPEDRWEMSQEDIRHSVAALRAARGRQRG